MNSVKYFLEGDLKVILIPVNYIRSQMILFLFLVKNSKMKTRNSGNSSQAAIVSSVVKKKSSAMASTERPRKRREARKERKKGKESN